MVPSEEFGKITFTKGTGAPVISFTAPPTRVWDQPWKIIKKQILKRILFIWQRSKQFFSNYAKVSKVRGF